MNCERSLIASVIFLGAGLGLLFGYCHGTIGFSAAYPMAGASLQIAINTAGFPAVAGVVLTLVGLLLLIVALIQAVVSQWPEGAVKTAVPAK